MPTSLIDGIGVSKLSFRLHVLRWALANILRHQSSLHDLCEGSVRSCGPHAHKLSPGHRIRFSRMAVGALWYAGNVDLHDDINLEPIPILMNRQSASSTKWSNAISLLLLSLLITYWIARNLSFRIPLDPLSVLSGSSSTAHRSSRTLRIQKRFEVQPKS